MTIPHALKLELVERFTPMLYLDPAEPDYPVSPVDYVEHAALWSSVPPEHPKASWGVAVGAARRPLIEAGGISLDPAHDVRGASDPDGDGVPEHYLGQRDDDGTFPFLRPRVGEPWLDLAGWQDGSAVTASTKNLRTSDALRPPLRQPWLTAEVWDFEDLREQLGDDGLARRFGLGPADRPEPLAALVVVAFHFLFPAHRQPRRLTALDPASDPYSGDFEGDWVSFAVLTRLRPADRSRPPRVDDFEPMYGGFGQRWRGTRVEHDDQAATRMELREWSTLARVDDHAVVVAARGTHNLYPHDAPTRPDGTVRPQWIEFGQSTSEPANAFARDTTEEPWSPVFAAKVLLGAALGGPLGMVVGIGAAAAEASWAEEEGLFDPEVEAQPPPERDDPFADDAWDLERDKIGAPRSVAMPPFADPSSEVRHWESDAQQALAGGSLLLASVPSQLPSYMGRWGVRVDRDPLSLRSGIRFPDWRAEVVDALLRVR